MQERLNQEIAVLDRERDERRQTLRTNYINALERRLAELRVSGHTEAVAALEKEKQRAAHSIDL